MYSPQNASVFSLVFAAGAAWFVTRIEAPAGIVFWKFSAATGNVAVPELSAD